MFIALDIGSTSIKGAVLDLDRLAVVADADLLPPP